MSASRPLCIHWFRRDLRWHDNRALHAALQSEWDVLPLFIFDETILGSLKPEDPRVTFIHETIAAMKVESDGRGKAFCIAHGKPKETFELLFAQHDVRAVFVNEDYEPRAVERDEAIEALCQARGVRFEAFKDHVIMAPGEVLKPDGLPYTVFTPFSKRWHANLTEEALRPAPSESMLHALVEGNSSSMPSLESMGFKGSQHQIPACAIDQSVVKSYHETRDIPSIQGTSRISVHLRFGTLSIRQAANQGRALNDKWLTELIWRDFYQAIIKFFPHSVNKAFKPAYDRVPWEWNEEHFERWRRGETGYPLVDAGMRELAATGFMHNRVRMVVASFFCKHLLHDWRLGERHFAENLMDFELASNVGGWQWASGTGCDAAPYFRVFNPTSQWAKFDPQSEYVRTWVPEFEDLTYAKPVVEHKWARQRAIDTYKSALANPT